MGFRQGFSDLFLEFSEDAKTLNNIVLEKQHKIETEAVELAALGRFEVTDLSALSVRSFRHRKFD